MTSPIRTERHDNVLVIISDNPPVNALGQAVRAGLTDGIAEALADDSVEAVVIRCDGRTFFAGADITEFGKPPQGPSLPEALDKLRSTAPRWAEAAKSRWRATTASPCRARSWACPKLSWA